MEKTAARVAFLLLLLAMLPEFASAAAAVYETNGRYLRIILETRSDKAFANGIEWKAEWKCETLGDGVIEEVSFRDYFDAVEEELSQKAEEGMTVLPEYPAPGGYVEFYFKGVRPGLADLRVTCEEPGQIAPFADARFRIAVFSDLKTHVFESSVKYDWGDLE